MCTQSLGIWLPPLPLLLTFSPKPLLYNPSIFLCNPSILLYNPSIILYNPSIFLYNPSIILYIPSILLYNSSINIFHKTTILLYNPALCGTGPGYTILISEHKYFNIDHLMDKHFFLAPYYLTVDKITKVQEMLMNAPGKCSKLKPRWIDFIVNISFRDAYKWTSNREWVPKLVAIFLSLISLNRKYQHLFSIWSVSFLIEIFLYFLFKWKW